ncbi:MAG: acyl carrier protein [Bacteroidales bacterium]|nr:acyl carrier protein [Bacteroidales bacterium]
MNNIKIDAPTIKEKVKSYIYQAVHVDKEKIRNDSLIFKEGFFDSMGFILLVTYIEEEFRIKTTDADLLEENFESIDAITDFIARKTES